MLVLTATILISSCNDDDYLESYNREELFARPTQTELDNVYSNWNSRNLNGTDYHVEQEVNVAGTNAVLKIISFRLNGLKEYGALLIPEGKDNLPVRVYVGGFGIDITVNSIKLLADNLSEDAFIFAFPALRGQSLSITINNAEYNSPTSEGEHCDAFEGASDDVIAFLNVIERTEARANINRTTVRGGSRGATVSLLVAARDKRVKGAIAVAGPVDLLYLTSSMENDRTYQCQFLRDLVNTEKSIEETRLKMISSSPVYFAASLPKTQLHLGQDDTIVPVSQGEELKAAMSEVGNNNLLELFVYSGRSHQNIATDNIELNNRINEFLKQF